MLKLFVLTIWLMLNPYFPFGVWNFGTPQAEGTYMTSPNKNLGTESLLNFPGRQPFTRAGEELSVSSVTSLGEKSGKLPMCLFPC